MRLVVFILIAAVPLSRPTWAGEKAQQFPLTSTSRGEACPINLAALGAKLPEGSLWAVAPDSSLVVLASPATKKAKAQLSLRSLDDRNLGSLFPPLRAEIPLDPGEEVTALAYADNARRGDGRGRIFVGTSKGRLAVYTNELELKTEFPEAYLAGYETLPVTQLHIGRHSPVLLEVKTDHVNVRSFNGGLYSTLLNPRMAGEDKIITHPSGVTDVDFRRGTLPTFATAGTDGAAYLFQVRRDSPRNYLTPRIRLESDSPLEKVRLLPGSDQRMVVADSEGKITATGRKFEKSPIEKVVVRAATSQPITSMEFAPGPEDEPKLLVLDTSGALSIIKGSFAKGGRPDEKPIYHPDSRFYSAIWLDNEHILVGTAEGDVEKWRVSGRGLRAPNRVLIYKGPAENPQPAQDLRLSDLDSSKFIVSYGDGRLSYGDLNIQRTDNRPRQPR